MRYVLVVISLVINGCCGGGSSTSSPRQEERVEDQQPEPPVPETSREVPEELPQSTLPIPQEKVSPWVYEESEDLATGQAFQFLEAKSLNSFELNFPYQEVQNGKIVFRIHPRHGQDVLVGVTRGQITSCNRYRGGKVTIRFDNDIVEWGCNAPESRNSTFFFLRREREFLQRAERAKTLVITPVFHRRGNVPLQFPTEGLREALDEHEMFRPTKQRHRTASKKD